jgi:hypothetical protein
MTQVDFTTLNELTRVDEIHALIESHTSKVCQQKEREARLMSCNRVDTRRHYVKDESVTAIDE